MYLVRSCASILGPTDVRPAVHQVNVRLLIIIKDFDLYRMSNEHYNFVFLSIAQDLSQEKIQTSVHGDGEGSCIWGWRLPS